MKRDIISIGNTTKTFQMTSHDITSHSRPYEEAYLNQMEKEASIKKYISIEERAKRRQPQSRNRRGAQSRKLHNTRRKLARVKKLIQKKKEEIIELERNNEITSKESTPSTENIVRNKFPIEYNNSSIPR